MTRNTDPRKSLANILHHWPSAGDDIESSHARLKNHLAPEFERHDLANTPNHAFDTVSRPLVSAHNAVFVVTDSTDPDILNLVKLRQASWGEWLLVAFKFQCATCFGTGINGAEPCDVCGAEGWGLAGED